MTHFRVRPRAVREAIAGLSSGTALLMPAGKGLRGFYAMPWREIYPGRALTVGAKARQCVEYDRKCDLIAKARG